MKRRRWVAQFLKRGSLWRFESFILPGGPRAKFCVAMETYQGTRQDVVVVLSTSNERAAAFPSVVEIPDGTVAGLTGDSFVDVCNVHEVPFEAFRKSGCAYVNQLPNEIIDKLNVVLQFADNVPRRLVLRMRPPDKRRRRN